MIASLKTRSLDYIFDTNGSAVASFDLEAKKTKSKIPGLDFSDFTPTIKGGIKQFKLTIDAQLQNLVHSSFKNKNGTFILLNLDDNSILVSYSKPREKKGVNAALNQLFEPASTIKPVTLLTYLLNRKGKTLFPVDCQGQIRVKGEDGKRWFRDWSTHGRIETSVQALSWSCNVSFAKMGLASGIEVHASRLKKFLFNTPDLKDRFVTLRMGTFNSNASNEYQLANPSPVPP